MLPTQWQIRQTSSVPQWLQDIVKLYLSESEGKYAVQILWQRGINQPEKLPGFLDANCYKPTSPFAFGQEMKWAIKRLGKARETGEKIAIWGDFDADGITATSVLWEGLGEFFSQGQQLIYYIPNRLSESHGLNQAGLDKLAKLGVKLIVTCDTGSTNLTEIKYSQQLDIDIIITDHHTLPAERPEVVSIINPRYFADTHPLFHLSGVAVAYKLVEALYEAWPHIPQKKVEELLDLVAIGLIADLVELSGDCRYLAQKGIAKLQKTTRLDIVRLLELCKKSGDRPTDISFGIGPRINAVSRIQGDASFCVELLTSKDHKRCFQLAELAELANTRRKALQQDIIKDVKKQVAKIDLSTTGVIVLENPQWQAGILGLVAGRIAQEYNRPTILLSSSEDKIARGSARSIQNIDLYKLVESQANLLHRFGGHPLAAGLSLPVENLGIFRDRINQELRQKVINLTSMSSSIEVDLIVTVADLGKALFKELKLLEPYGMGNSIPKLLIKNCWFSDVWNKNSEDFKGKQVKYIRTYFNIWDDSIIEGFPGIWWEHRQEELPMNQNFDAIVELDFNAYEKEYQVRLIELCPLVDGVKIIDKSRITNPDLIIDWRDREIPNNIDKLISLKNCPLSWQEIRKKYQQAVSEENQLALAYSAPKQSSPTEIWQQLLGIAKYLLRTGERATIQQLQDELGISQTNLEIGLQTLDSLGFSYQISKNIILFHDFKDRSSISEESIATFLESVTEEQFQRQYFYQVSLTTLVQTLTA